MKLIFWFIAAIYGIPPVFHIITGPFLYTEDIIRHPVTEQGGNVSNCRAEINVQKKIGDQNFDKTLTSCSVEHISFATTGTEITSKSFRLAHLEAEPEDARGFNKDQLENIKNLVKSSKALYVVVYVHGWRHNSKVENGNLNAFRLMLGYSRQFLDNKDREKSYSITPDLIGVYVGWRGALINEEGCETSASIFANWKSTIKCVFAVPNAFLSFWSRKAQSEQLASPLIDALKDIKSSINNSDARMLVVGHSMGGNMLLTGLTEKLKNNFDNHHAGTTVKLEIADQVVLLNPASEAQKWTQMQEAIHLKTGIDDDFSNYVESNWLSEFLPDQTPDLISITATCWWNNADTDSIKKAKENNKSGFFGTALQFIGVYASCDTATGFIFPAAQLVSLSWLQDLFTGEAWRQIMAAGHYLPNYDKINPNEKNAIGRVLGVSHQVILNGTKGDGSNSTSWAGASNSDRSECIDVSGALARIKNGYGGGHAYWDSGSGESKDRIKPPAFRHSTEDPSFNIQVRRGSFVALDKPYINQNGRKTTDASRNSIVPPHSPIWNMAALNAIVEHNTFLNYPTWCFINQLVLDDITNPQLAN